MRKAFVLGVLTGVVLWMGVSFVMTGPFIVWRASHSGRK